MPRLALALALPLCLAPVACTGGTGGADAGGGDAGEPGDGGHDMSADGMCGVDATRTATTEDGALTVTWSGDPSPLPLNEHFDLEIDVAAEMGDLPADLTVEVDAAMPQHGHGMNTAPVVTAGSEAGRFLADGMLFHMPGTWELYLDVSSDGGATAERLTFEVECQEM